MIGKEGIFHEPLLWAYNMLTKSEFIFRINRDTSKGGKRVKNWLRAVGLKPFFFQFEKY